MTEKAKIERRRRWMMNLKALLNREKVPIYDKMKPKPPASHLVNYKKEKLYSYYICDYCGAEIKILNKRYKMIGGTVIMPHTVTKSGEIKLALCNKCLKLALKEFEDM